MVTLQKFKLLATQCGVGQSPTRSPRTSPVVHLRRRKTTLRMLIGLSGGRRSPYLRGSTQPIIPVNLIEKKEKDLVGRTLKDLFGSSPKIDEDEAEIKGGIRGKSEAFLNIGGAGGGGDGGFGGGPGSPRPVLGGFRFRSRSMLRRAWRPMLVSIPE